MTAGKNIKVIFDTNVWISFLIGKRLQIMQDYISDGSITIVVTDQLLTEIIEVTKRPKIKKYFPAAKVKELISFLNIIALNVEVSPKQLISKDPKDNFLFDLVEASNADYLVTGDKELLSHSPFKTAAILSPADFEQVLK
jgi:uncharacterized protein